jgi:hypothetical protein
MPMHFRKRMKFGPLVFNFGKTGFTSWGLQIGRWSWNPRSRKHYVDTPGLGYVEFGGRRRRR